MTQSNESKQQRMEETLTRLARNLSEPELEALKQRDPAKPSSVLFWSIDDALAALDGAPDAVLRAVTRLLPGPIGLIVPNPQRRFASACGEDPSSLGIRVPLLAARAAAGAPTAGAPTAGALSAGSPRTRRASAQPSLPPIVQTSANLAGGPDPTTLDAVPAAVRAGADLILDGGSRPGVPSTIVDLRGVTDEFPDGWRLVREGPVSRKAIAAVLAGS